MDMVPIADDRRPENGKTSGPRAHCMLTFTLPTIVDNASTSGAAAAASRVKMAACWPFHDFFKTSMTDARSSYLRDGSRRRRGDGSRRRRGRDVDMPRRLVAATPRPRRGYAGDGSRRRRGRDADSPRKLVARRDQPVFDDCCCVGLLASSSRKESESPLGRSTRPRAPRAQTAPRETRASPP